MSTEITPAASIIFRSLRIFLLLAGQALAAQTAVLECVADATVALRGADRGRLSGGAPVVRVSAGDSAALVQFRVSVIEGWRIAKATLLVRVESGRVPRRLAANLATAAWRESDERTALPGRRHPGGRSNVTVLKEGWISVDLDRRLVQALADRKAEGLLLEWGQTAAGTVVFHARESLHLAPYLIVEAAGAAARAPMAQR